MPGNVDATLFLCNLDEKVDERILFEIMMQAGPLIEVYMPRDKETSRHKGYAFAEFTSEKSAQYALNLFGGLLNLFGKQIRISVGVLIWRHTQFGTIFLDISAFMLVATASKEEYAQRYQLLTKFLILQISGQDKAAQIKPKSFKDSKELSNLKPLETNEQPQRNSPVFSTPPSYATAYQNYSASSLSGHGRYLSPPVLAQSYNAQLVSLGEWGSRNFIPNRGFSRSYQSF